MARARVRFIPNRTFTAQLERENVDVPRAAARQALSSAKSSAPSRSGRYRASLQVREEFDGATLFTDDFAGHLVEWGSINNRAHRVLTSAAIATGCKVDVK